MFIREIELSDDKYKISEIYEQSWKYSYAKIIPKEYLDKIEKERWVPFLNLKDIKTFIVIENEEYIGTSSFRNLKIERLKNCGELISIYLKPRYINKGYGKALMTKVIEEMKKEGYEKIILYVLEENYSARKFYEKLGFINTKEYLRDNIGGKELKEIRYIYNFIKE